MTFRLIITGKNCELPRELFARPSSHLDLPGRLPAPTCEEGFYSGMTPESAAGGTRSLVEHIRPQPTPSHSQPRLGVHLAELAVMFAGGVLVVAGLSMVLL